MSALLVHLRTRIAAQGPLSVADYMAECLLHPTLGYYTTGTPFGAGGDFTTAPEISQMFGELVGLSLAQAWLDQGAPSPFVLAELGPGRGTLMADILRATRGVPGFHGGLRLHLVEASPALRAVQARALAPLVPRFADTADDLPRDLPVWLVANEFFDALPIRQYLRDGPGWRERLVGATATGMTFGLGPRHAVPALEPRLPDTSDGDLVELCPAAPAVMQAVGGRIQAAGGAALIADYGGWGSLGDTLQAVAGHRKVDPLADPGRADLTAHVDFRALAAAAPCAVTAMTPQGVVLDRLGISARAQALARGLTGEALLSHQAAHRRLTHPDEMGNLFQMIGLHPIGATPLPGLDP